MWEDIKEIISIITIIAISIFSAVIVILLSGYYLSTYSAQNQAETLASLGYETKAIRTNCYVMHGGRWLYCSTLLTNQIEIRQGEE